MNFYLQSLAFTANTIAPIFFIVFLGALLKKIKLIDSSFVNTTIKLVFNVTLPTLVFMAIAGTNFQVVPNIKQVLYFIGATVFSFILIWWIAAYWIKNGADLGAFIQGSFRSNAAVVGLAIAYNLFADKGLAETSILMAAVIPLYNILSIIALTVTLHRTNIIELSKKILLGMIKNPLIIAFILALPFSFMDWNLPMVVEKTVRYFANLTLPLALLTIGGSLNFANLKGTSTMVFWATATKLVILPISLTAGAWFFSFRGQQLAILFITFACPTLAASFITAKTSGANHELTANIILATTIGSVFSLSVGLYFLRVWGVI